MIWYQNRLRRQKEAKEAGDSKAEQADNDTANQQAETKDEAEPEHEVTDEYEIMEE